jgi:hypothetical protein
MELRNRFIITRIEINIFAIEKPFIVDVRATFKAVYSASKNN